MKKFQFLLLDAGPIIKLFELNLWERFIEMCDVAISRIVVDQAKYASQEFEDVRVDLEPYEKQIRIFDSDLSEVKTFYDKFNLRYKSDIHPGEKETLAFLCNSSENWRMCSADHVVFKILGLLGKAEQGISLEEILKDVGLPCPVNWEKITPMDREHWRYSKKFREKWTHKGQVDFIQEQGLR